MRKKLKLIPPFANEEEERLFWETHDSFDYVDWDNAVRVRAQRIQDWLGRPYMTPQCQHNTKSLGSPGHGVANDEIRLECTHSCQ